MVVCVGSTESRNPLSFASFTQDASQPAAPFRTWALAISYIAFFVNMGASCAVVGPTLLLLGRQVRSSLGSLTLVNAGRSLGFLAGTIFAGRVGDRAPHKRDQLISTAVLLMALTTVMMAEQSNVILLGAVSTLQASMAGVVDNLAQVLILSLSGIPVAPMMQAVHCGFGVGALIAPWIASFFLPSTALSSMSAAAARAGTTLHQLGDNHTAATELVAVATTLRTEEGAFTRFHMAYFIIALLSTPTLIAHASILWCGSAGSKSGRKTSDSAPLADAPHEPAAPAASAVHDPAHRRLVFLMCVFLFLYVGCESGWGAYLATYAVKTRGFSIKSASILTSAYWFSFAFTRFLGIFISMRVDNDKMLNVSLTLSLASLLTMVVFPSSTTMLWASCVAYGAGTATIYPCVITWLQTSARVDGATLAMVVGAACAGDALVPLVQGLTLSTPHPELFVVVAFVFLVLATVSYVVARRTVLPGTASAMSD